MVIIIIIINLGTDTLYLSSSSDIRKMESFSLLKGMRSLKKISIRGNPVCEILNFVDLMKTYFLNIENVEF